jgi:hypothetical protein
MAITILIDLYLLYIFFIGAKGTSPQQPRKREFRENLLIDDMRKFHRTAISPLEILLGYVIAIGGIVMLIYAALGKF